MPLINHLKFLDLCSVRIRGPGSAQGTHSRSISLWREDSFAEDFAIRVWFILIAKLKLVARGVILSNLIKNCERKLFTVELVMFERNAKVRTVLKAKKSTAAPSLEIFCVHSFLSVDVNLIYKKEDKQPLSPKKVREREFSVFCVVSWCQKNRVTGKQFFSELPELYAVHPENMNQFHPFRYPMGRHASKHNRLLCFPNNKFPPGVFGTEILEFRHEDTSSMWDTVKKCPNARQSNFLNQTALVGDS